MEVTAHLRGILSGIPDSRGSRKVCGFSVFLQGCGGSRTLTSNTLLLKVLSAYK